MTRILDSYPVPEFGRQSISTGIVQIPWYHQEQTMKLPRAAGKEKKRLTPLPHCAFLGKEM